MPKPAVLSIEFDIMRSLRCARNAALVLLACALPAGAQSLDDVLDDLLEEEIEEQVEDEIEAQIEGQVEDQIESQVEAQIESTVQDAIERQVESTVAEGIEAGIEAEVGIGADAGIGVEVEIGAEVGETIGIGIDTGIGAGLSLAANELIETLTAGSRGAAPFTAGIDPEDRAVEADVWVVLVPAEFADRIETWGFALLERRDLEALDRVLLRVAAPEDREIAEAALELALDAPGTVVDYNHVYESTADDEVTGSRPAEAAAGSPAPATIRPSAAPFAIGMIDSIVDPSHPALDGVTIEQRDFVPFGNERTVVHGTAVASVIVGAAEESPGQAALRKLRAASVFFRDEAQVRATTAGLVAALDWLAATPDLRVVNMSLAGPPNRLLEVALDDIATRDIIVVAAVGNNGPTGAPLYPAAYDTVVGVTAVDSGHRAYRYANRGRQVMFSAPGVQVEVAAPDGGFSTQSGTSLASPLVAALLGESIAAGRLSSAAAIKRLQATALDLGDRNYDEIYGYGLARRQH